MALQKIKEVGYFNSNVKVGNWTVPQEVGDDRPRGDKNYDSFRMSKALSFNGITKRIGELELFIDGADLKLSKGSATVYGHTIELEEDLIIEQSAQLITIGFNRNPYGSGDIEERSTFISVEGSVIVPTQDDFGQDSGFYSVKLYEKVDGDWRMSLPDTKTIKKYIETLSLISGSENIYDIGVNSIPLGIIENPENYNFDIFSIKVNVPKILPNNGNDDFLRLRKGSLSVKAKFDEDKLTTGINTVYIYRDSSNLIKATTGKGK